MSERDIILNLRSMIEHRLGQDIVSFQSIDNPEHLYLVSYQDGEFFSVAYRPHPHEQEMVKIELDDYSEWFICNIIDSMLAIGCE